MSNTYNSKSLTDSALRQAFLQATGPIEFNMTNDYMFKPLMPKTLF